MTVSNPKTWKITFNDGTWEEVTANGVEEFDTRLRFVVYENSSRVIQDFVTYPLFGVRKWRLVKNSDSDEVKPINAKASVSTEIIHGAPFSGSGLTPCCNASPFELPWNDRMDARPDNVNCPTWLERKNRAHNTSRSSSV